MVEESRGGTVNQRTQKGRQECRPSRYHCLFVLCHQRFHAGNECRAIHLGDDDRVPFRELCVAVKVGHGLAARNAALAFHMHARFLRGEKVILHRIEHGGGVMHRNAGQAELRGERKHVLQNRMEELRLRGAERCDLVDLSSGQVALERYVKADHVHRNAALEHHFRSFRISIDVKLRCRGRVAKRCCAAHDDDSADQAGQVAVLAAADFDYAVASEERACLALPGPGFVYAPAVAGADAGYAYVLIGGKAVGKLPVVYGETIEQTVTEEKPFWKRIFTR